MIAAGTLDNPLAVQANARFPEVKRMMPTEEAYGVGIWKMEWGFAPCSADCNAFLFPKQAKQAKQAM
jgi:hypothetical protein